MRVSCTYVEMGAAEVMGTAATVEVDETSGA